jgi:tRNA(Ile)-lysidine synthase
MRAAAPSAADLSGADADRDRLRPVPAADFAALMAPLGPFGPAPFLLVGVSGGPHSLALALLARDWAGARGGRLMAAICDHGLRPDSGAEAASVAAMLAGQGIAARSLALAVAPGPAMQDRARQARLRALLALCEEVGAPWLLLGHHRADQAETVLLRALAGSGPAGLAGMGPARPAQAALLLRPLLGLAPARLEAVVAAAGLAPVRDPSNADPRFTRARLRAALADPGGEGAATSALAEAAQRFARRRDAMAAAVAERLAASARLHEAGFARIDLAALGRDGVARAALAALVRALGGAAFAPAEAGIARLLAAGHGTLGGAVLRRDGLLLREAAGLAPPVAARLGAAWDGRFRLVGAGGEGFMIGPAGVAARRLPRPAAIPAAVVPTLPALHRNGVLAVLPALAYPAPDVASRHGFVFAPIAGPVAEA